MREGLEMERRAIKNAAGATLGVALAGTLIGAPMLGFLALCVPGLACWTASWLRRAFNEDKPKSPPPVRYVVEEEEPYENDQDLYNILSHVPNLYRQQQSPCKSNRDILEKGNEGRWRLKEKPGTTISCR